jgi:hypothetical protein
MAAPINSNANMILPPVRGPSHVGDQTIARVIRRDDGSGFVQTWRRGVGWVKGGADFSEFIYARAVPETMARRQGIE